MVLPGGFKQRVKMYKYKFESFLDEVKLTVQPAAQVVFYIIPGLSNVIEYIDYSISTGMELCKEATKELAYNLFVIDI